VPLLLVHVLLLAFAPATRAQPAPPPPPAAPDETLAPDYDARIAKALAYLARQQQPDGSFQNVEQEGNGGDKKPRFGGPKVALTSLSLTAYLAAGRMPDAGKHALNARNAIDYLLKAAASAGDDGYVGKLDGSRMPGHAMATLALAEAYGAESDPSRRARTRAALARAVRVLLKAQDARKDDAHRGGWGADPTAADSDLLVTGWCVIALRASLNVGIDVPRDSADRAADYVLRCWRPDKSAFAQRATDGKDDASTAATAVGGLALQLLDRARRPEVTAAAKYLADHPVGRDTEYACLARFAGTWAAHQQGGPAWPAAWDRTQAKLLGYQNESNDGSIPAARKNSKETGLTYTTAMSVLTLTIPMRLLPSYQR
jgi:hypothetical protein